MLVPNAVAPGFCLAVTAKFNYLYFNYSEILKQKCPRKQTMKVEKYCKNRQHIFNIEMKSLTYAKELNFWKLFCNFHHCVYSNLIGHHDYKTNWAIFSFRRVSWYSRYNALIFRVSEIVSNLRFDQPRIAINMCLTTFVIIVW